MVFAGDKTTELLRCVSVFTGPRFVLVFSDVPCDVNLSVVAPSVALGDNDSCACREVVLVASFGVPTGAHFDCGSSVTVKNIVGRI